MRKIIFTFGLIAGAIEIAMICTTMPLYKSGTLSFDKGEIIGYTSMVIALSLIFFGVKSYRDNHLNGAIKFGKALKVGLLIALVASLVYAIGWEIYFNLFIPDFMDQYAVMCMAKAQQSGADAAALQKVTDQINSMKEMYKNPFLRFGLTIAEMLPVGVLIALISAAVLRNVRRFKFSSIGTSRLSWTRSEQN